MDPASQMHRIADTVYEIYRVYAEHGTFAERLQYEIRLRAKEMTAFDRAVDP